MWTVGEAESVFFLSMKGLRIRHLIMKYKIDSHLLKKRFFIVSNRPHISN